MLEVKFLPPIYVITGADAGGSYPVEFRIAVENAGGWPMDSTAEAAIIQGVMDAVLAVPTIVSVSMRKISETITPDTTIPPPVE
ncbi:hypothetical protein [Streptomyces sp. NPDC023838]|uniref:hypothetical protein n=1 Tax=Streptomyces sp. NPDC023838 TaxID=3154325 RepID=UPI0033E432ED